MTIRITKEFFCPKCNYIKRLGIDEEEPKICPSCRNSTKGYYVDNSKNYVKGKL